MIFAAAEHIATRTHIRIAPTLECPAALSRFMVRTIAAIFAQLQSGGTA